MLHPSLVNTTLRSFSHRFASDSRGLWSNGTTSALMLVLTNKGSKKVPFLVALTVDWLAKWTLVLSSQRLMRGAASGSMVIKQPDSRLRSPMALGLTDNNIESKHTAWWEKTPISNQELLVSSSSLCAEEPRSATEV
jgi:hypothetical protein